MQKQCKASAEQKGKPKDLLFVMPSRSLFYEKAVQGESRAKRKAEGFAFPMPSRSLFYEKAGKSDTNMSALACLQMSG